MGKKKRMKIKLQSRESFVIEDILRLVEERAKNTKEEKEKRK